MNRKLINYNKKHRCELYTFYRKKIRIEIQNLNLLVGSGTGTVFSEADPDPHQNEADPKH